jgi:hypothetical protein
MSLPQAQLGYLPNINLGAYIPAKQQRESLWERALASLVTGAVGGVTGKVVDNTFQKDFAAEGDKASWGRKMVGGPTTTREQFEKGKSEDALMKRFEGQLDLERRRVAELEANGIIGRAKDQFSLDTVLPAQVLHLGAQTKAVQGGEDRANARSPVDIENIKSQTNATNAGVRRDDLGALFRNNNLSAQTLALLGNEGRTRELHPLARAQAASNVAATNASAGATQQSIENMQGTNALTQAQEEAQRMNNAQTRKLFRMDENGNFIPVQEAPPEEPGKVLPFLKSVGMYPRNKVEQWFQGDLTPASATPDIDAKEAATKPSKTAPSGTPLPMPPDMSYAGNNQSFSDIPAADVLKILKDTPMNEILYRMGITNVPLNQTR